MTDTLDEPVDVHEAKVENLLVESTIKINYCSFDRVGLNFRPFFLK